MRWGVIADVHGNLHALDAALRFLADEGIERFLCAGDLVGYGPLPNATVERALALPGHVVAGNHELIVLGELGEEDCTEFARASLHWTRGALEAGVRARLADLPRRLVVADGVALAHGSWRDPRRYVRSTEDARAALQELSIDVPAARILVVGHTHEPALFGLRAGALLRGSDGEVALPDAEPLLLNPGSVGQARGGAPARARVAILDCDRRVASFHAVRYDVRGCRRALREAGQPPSSCHVDAGYLQRMRYELGRRCP